MSKKFNRRTFPLPAVWIKAQKCATRRKAFTLVELLVVVSVIALLLSVLMPGQLKAKQHALRMVCRRNLHNYGVASTMFLSDNDEEFMDPWQNIYWSCQGQSGHEKFQCDGSHPVFPGEAQRYCRWHNIDYSLSQHPEYAGPLWSYLEEEVIILCSVFADLAEEYGATHPVHDVSIDINPQHSYSQNAYLGAAGSAYTWLDGGVAKASEVASPAETFFFGEENLWTISTPRVSTATLNDTALLTRFNRGDVTAALDAFGTFHSPPNGDLNLGTSNAVMLDGSVTAVSPYNDGTFRKAWPGSKDEVNYREDRDPADGAKLP